LNFKELPRARGAAAALRLAHWHPFGYGGLRHGIGCIPIMIIT
jgi:hypothetical protein